MIDYAYLKKSSQRRPPPRFFTLIEMLVALAIFTLAVVTVASVAGGGLKIYRRAQFISGSQTDLLLGMERLEKELRGCFIFDTIGFAGTADEVSFPGMVSRWDALGQTFTRAPGRITYQLDRLEGGWVRRDQNYGQAVKEDGEGEKRLLAKHVRSLQFDYCKYDVKEKKYTWQSTWDKQEAGLPVAVKVRMKLEETGGIANFERTLLLPAGSQPWQAPINDPGGETGTVK